MEKMYAGLTFIFFSDRVEWELELEYGDRRLRLPDGMRFPAEFISSNPILSSSYRLRQRPGAD